MNDGVERAVIPDDFVPAVAVSAFHQSMDCIVGFFAKATGQPARRFAPFIQRQVFENATLASPLFRLFLMNSVNRAHGAPVQAGDWAKLADVFMDWDAGRFARCYPLNGNCPSEALRSAFAEAASSRNIIRGNVGYHLEALQGRNGARNGWVRLLQTAQRGSHLLAGRPGSNRVLDDAIAMRALWGFDLTAIPLDCLTVDDLWRATDRLVAVPGMGRQLALNFIKDAGYGHAFKPDTHTRKIAGMAFRAEPQEYRATDAGERACVDAALAYAQALSAHGSWNGWSLAAVDRLMGLAGSGRLWIMGEDALCLKKRGAAGRRRAVAKILRGALRLGRFDA